VKHLQAIAVFNLFTVLKKLKECVGFFFFNNLIATNGSQVYLVADLVTQNFKFRRNEERRTKLE
jgi:hypothetical protein